MLRLALSLLLLVSVAHSQTSVPQTQPDGALISVKPYVLPAFESSREIAQYATKDEYTAAIADQSFELERLEYSSEALTVSAYVYRPVQAKGKYPVIIFNRGSYVVHDQAPVLLTMFRRLAQEGFVVVAPMLRGSDGTSGQDEIGGSDLHDLLNVFPLLRHLEYADADTVFMYGESRGGVMTLLALREGAPIKAAATFGAITDMAAYVNSTPQIAKMAPQIWPDFNQNKEGILKARSAQRWPEKIKAPILLMHGAADPQVPPIQTLQLAEELAKQGSNYGVIIYPGDNHILSHHREDRDREVAAWFRSFLDHTTSSGQ